MTPCLSEAFDLWPEEAIEAIHAASLELLERAGARVESEKARRLLQAAGCAEGPGGRLLVPRRAVDEALATCPRRFTLAARDPTRDLELDPGPAQTYVHNMGGAPDIVDPYTGATRRATMRDQVLLTRVMHQLRYQHTITSLVTPGGVPGPLEPLYSFVVLAHESDKYLGGPGISYAFQARFLIEMAQAVTGADGSGGRYPLDLAFSPVSPLLLGATVSDALIAAARHGGVVCEILPCPAAATTAPGAIAAAVAQQNAEVLAGVVLAQAAAPGTPVYYGPRLSAVDPRTGVVVSGSPETGVASVAATLLARRYGLACDCYGPTTDSKVVDGQFAYEHAINALLGLLARPRLLSGIGDVQAGLSTCLEALVIDDEVLNHVFYAVTPRPWDGEALDVEAMIGGALSGRGFLGTKHTRRFIRTEFVTPLLSYRGGLGEWLAAGRGSVLDLARERVHELVERAPVGLPEDVLAELCRLVGAAAEDAGVGSYPDPRRLLKA